MTEAPGFWNDAAVAEKVLKEIASIKWWVESLEKLYVKYGDLEVTAEFVKEHLA